MKIGLMAVAGIALVAICNVNRAHFGTIEGVPYIIPIVLVVLAACTVLLQRTRFGRYVYAIGGNAEAARRAGVSLPAIRTWSFILAALIAGIAGMLFASWQVSLTTNIIKASNSYVLLAVAAAVIGGTSLFGGRGKTSTASSAASSSAASTTASTCSACRASGLTSWSPRCCSRRRSSMSCRAGARRAGRRHSGPDAGPGSALSPQAAPRERSTAGSVNSSRARPSALRPARWGMTVMSTDGRSDGGPRRPATGGRCRGSPSTRRCGWARRSSSQISTERTRGSCSSTASRRAGSTSADPGYLEFEYVRRIGHVADLAFPPGEPLRVLHLGGGALTLPRYLAHTRPGSRQLVAELDDALTEPGPRAPAAARRAPDPGARRRRPRRGGVGPARAATTW